MDIAYDNKLLSTLIVKGNISKKQIALTYDSGLKNSETAQILDVLKKHNIKCTFFLTGYWTKKFSNLAQKIVSEGHEIGNHSFNHPDMRNLTFEEIIKNIKAGEETIKNITGITTELFRLPFGHWNDDVLKAVAAAGYKNNIYWSIDTLDWSFPPIQSMLNRILKNPQNGDIVLMHVVGHGTAFTTDRAIENLKARGFTFVTVSELLE